MPGASGGKQPYRIGLRAQGQGGRVNDADGADSIAGIFAFAGLYDIWHGPDGQELRTYAIVTTRANEALSALHERMPVILPADAEEAWLNRNNKDIEQLVSLLQPFPEERMTAYPVSKLVNSVAHDGRELIEPLRRLAL